MAIRKTNEKGRRFCDIACSLDFISLNDAETMLQIQRISKDNALKGSEWKRIGQELQKAEYMTPYQVELVFDLMNIEE